jgi:lysophospholipase L1-like esterase
MTKSLTLLCLILTLLLSFRHARSDEPVVKPLPFENEIKAFEASDAKAMPPKDAVLFLGSSSIRMWKTLAKDFPDQKVIHRGFGGSQTRDAINYIDRIVVPYHPRQILFYEGDNDINAGKTPEKVAADFKEFVEKTRAKLPGVRIDFICIKPSIARWKLVDKIKEANRLIEAYTRTAENVEYINVFDAMLGDDGKPLPDIFIKDGLHMNEKGYAIWTKIIRERIR